MKVFATTWPSPMGRYASPWRKPSRSIWAMKSFGHDGMDVLELVAQLDSFLLSERIAALGSLCHLEQRGQWKLVGRVGPTLPSYDHVHTTASYGSSIPGVFSARTWFGRHTSRKPILR